MFGKSYKIVEPKRFDIYIDNISCEENEAIVKIKYGAICKADIRYYIGERDKKLLGLKYPMSLIHEAIGVVIKDNTGKLSKGDRVALIPNSTYINEEMCKCKVCKNPKLGENYCKNSKFASSSCDGFSREYVNYPTSNLIKIPDDVDFDIAVFSELISVAISAYRRLDLKGTEKIGIWGDGILGYIMYCVLKCIHKNDEVIIVGKEEEKISKFPTEKLFVSGDPKIECENIEVAYECVGGKYSRYAIDEIINSIGIGGKIILAGVAEEDISINTRRILEKGLALYGVTRSSISDFEKGIELFNNGEFVENISKLIIEEYEVNDIIDYYNVFEKEVYNKDLGKHILRFNL